MKNISKNSKQRLLEVMSKVDSTFRKKLNEDFYADNMQKIAGNFLLELNNEFEKKLGGVQRAMKIRNNEIIEEGNDFIIFFIIDIVNLKNTTNLFIGIVKNLVGKYNFDLVDNTSNEFEKYDDKKKYSKFANENAKSDFKTFEITHNGSHSVTISFAVTPKFSIVNRDLNLNEYHNYPMGAEYDPQAPYNQNNDNELWNDEKVVEPEEFDPYDKHKDDSMDDSMDETPDDGIDRNNPHYQIGGLTTQYNNLLGEIKKLYEYINKNNPSINVVGAIIEAIISRQDKMQTPEDNLNVDESKWGKTRANPKYTHFAVLKDNNKIVTGWEYRGYDPEELRLEKKHYFLNDVKDLQVDPKIVKIVTTKALQKLGIDPYDYNNWSKDDSIFTLEENKVSE